MDPRLTSKPTTPWDSHTERGRWSDDGLFDLNDYAGAEPSNPRVALDLPRPKSAVDEAREFGGWCRNKLDLLRLYLRMYRTVAGNGTYIDGYAGTGEVYVDGQRRLGSARIAIRSKAFRRMHFFELPANAAKLQRNLLHNVPTADRLKCTIHEGDVNELIGPLLASGEIAPDKPCFAFLDPNSTQLSWTTVEALARFKGGGGGGLKVELWILLNTYQALSRLMPKMPPLGYGTGPEAATLDRVMGARAAWWDVHTQRKRPAVLATRYARRLQDLLGYGAARVHPIIDPKTNKVQYHMIQASDHKAAFSFMQWAERETSQECYRTLSLFGEDLLGM